MNPYELAWKGVTIEDKKRLLDHSLLKRNRLAAEGKIKDAQLGLASTCVDIIGTSRSAIREAEREKNMVMKAEWQELQDEAVSISKEAVDKALKGDKSDWSPSDFEVAGAILSKTADGDIDILNKASEILQAGFGKAEETADLNEQVLILGQLIRNSIEKVDIKEVEKRISELNKIVESNSFDNKVMTRLRRALAEGNKYLAIEYAKKAESENQELKARNI
jgi:hypothetical protein